MELNKELPIKKIGESNWVENLTLFLEDYDVNVEGCSNLDLHHLTSYNFTTEMIDYYKYFGGIDSSDFMYNLKKINELGYLSDSIWEFVHLNFPQDELSNYIVISESPANDPVCFNIRSQKIHLFSHDPLTEKLIFNDFTDFLLFELVSLEKLMGDASFKNEEDENAFYDSIMDDKGIDSRFRYLKM